jgi:hypothetical protein
MPTDEACSRRADILPLKLSDMLLGLGSSGYPGRWYGGDFAALYQMALGTRIQQQRKAKWIRKKLMRAHFQL